MRNTLAAAAAEGARYAADARTAVRPTGEARTRDQIDDAISGRFARDVAASRTTIGRRSRGWSRSTVRATCPALGLGGPGVALEVSGHAVEEPR